MATALRSSAPAPLTGEGDLSLVELVHRAGAARLADHRIHLLDDGFTTVDGLRARRVGADAQTAATWFAAMESEHRLFSVPWHGMVIVPSFQLDVACSPRPELQPLLAILAAGGVGAWSTWSWLASPCPALDGAVPHELARSDPDAVADAARSYGARFEPWIEDGLSGESAA